MTLFHKSVDKIDQVTQDMKKVENEAISSIIDKKMTIIGEIDFRGKARVDGIIEGNIRGEHLILSEEGEVQGDIKVTSLNCYGSVKGDIEAQSLTARKGCTISGTVNAIALTVEPGACIHGNIQSGLPKEDQGKLLPKTESRQQQPEG